MRRGRHRPDHVDLGKPWERTLYFILLVMGSVRVVGNTVCERIHKEKKVQRVQFLFYFPKGGKGLRAEMCISASPEGWGL